jgi:FG-GAP-like repeat/RTX calcium-binding nonapeptide repeat (4 copies)
VHDTVSVLLGKGDGTLGAPTDFAVGGQPIRLVDAKLNADGQLDLAVANLDDGSVSVLLGKADGTFSAARTVAVTEGMEGSTLNDITDADFDGDGDIDLGVVSFSPGSIWVLLNKGDGTFGAPTNYGDVSDAHSITSADFNGDGKPDLAGTTATALESPIGKRHVWVLLGRGDGTFGEQRSFRSEFGYLAAADLSRDGRPDLAVAENPSAPGKVAVLLQCTMSGTLGPDLIDGTSGNDVICGMRGDDTIKGFGGADVLFGGNGTDTVVGGDGRDELRGQNSNDDLDAADGVGGNDRVNGGPQTDTCTADAGDMVLACES